MKKRILNISLILSLASTGSVFAQQGFGTNTPHKSAAVEIKSSNKGLLIPRMDLSIDSATGVISAPTITNPAQGLLVYNQRQLLVDSSTVVLAEGFYYFSGGKWNPIGLSALKDSNTTTITGNGTVNQPYVVEVKDLAGDVVGDILTNKVVKIQNVPVVSTVPSNGQVLKADSGTWTPSTLVATDISDPKTLSATKPLNANDGIGAVLKDVTLTIDTATATTLGVVKQGQNTTIVDGAINVAIADTNTLGVVKIGSGINVNNGVISVPPAPGETTTYLNFDSSTTNLTYISEDTSTSSLTLNLGDVIRNNQNNTYVTASTPIKIDSSTVGRNTTYNVSVDTATATTLGVVKPGTGLTINEGTLHVDTTAQGIGKNLTTDGLILVNDTTTLENSVLAAASLKVKAGSNGQVLTTTSGNVVWADPIADVETTITDVLTGAKHKIAHYKNESTDAPVDIYESVTSLVYDSSTNVTHISEDTSTLVFNLGDEVRRNQKTTTVVGNGAVNVTPTSANATGNTEYTVSVATADSSTLGVVKPGTGLTINEGTLNVDLTTTDIQQLRLDTITNTLTLERGGSVDLSKYLDNTDNQRLSFDTTTNVLSITGDSNTIDFTNYKNKAYTLASDTNTISLLADGTSVDSEIVVKNVALNLSTDNKLTATVNGVANTTALDLSIINTDNQYLTFDTSTFNLGISGDTRTVNLSGLVTKLDTGTNTTLVGNGTVAAPYKVGVNTGNGTSLGVVRQATDNPTVNVTNGELAVNLTNTVLSGEVTGPLNNTIVANDVIDAENLKANAVTTAKILDGNVTTAKIQPATDTSTTKILTTNSNGVVEWKNSAMPEFFYFPAINIPLGSGVQTLNLYNIYSSRWSQPAVVSNNAESQTLQSILIPENMLDIYITYYDTNVINSTTININNGVLSYEVNSNYTITDESYMNIVFRIRKTPKN